MQAEEKCTGGRVEMWGGKGGRRLARLGLFPR